MPAWCKAAGHKFLGVEEESGGILVYVKKHVNEGLEGGKEAPE